MSMFNFSDFTPSCIHVCVWVGSYKAARRNKVFGSSSDDGATQTASDATQVLSTVHLILTHWNVTHRRRNRLGEGRKKKRGKNFTPQLATVSIITPFSAN